MKDAPLLKYFNFMAEKPAKELFGEEIYPGLFLKAAIYMHGFATRQFFADGNKRTAYLTTSTFLEINGFTSNSMLEKS